MCRVLEVTRSGFYAWREREPSARACKEERLRGEVKAIHRMSRGRYGSPRVHAELQARGEQVSRRRVARLMRQEGLRGKKRRRFRVTTNSNHTYPIADNVLNRKFAVEQVGGSDQAWAADITYVPTREGWLYLAIVLDLASRLVVGWSMGETLEASLAVDALEMALQRRRLRRRTPCGRRWRRRHVARLPPVRCRALGHGEHVRAEQRDPVPGHPDPSLGHLRGPVTTSSKSG